HVSTGGTVVCVAVETAAARSGAIVAGAREQYHVRFGDLRRRRDADAGAARDFAGRQKAVASDAAEGRAVLVCVCESERRVAVASGRGDFDSAGTTLSRRATRAGGIILQLPHRRGSDAIARSRVAR